jgi:hypothetical protein
MNMVAGFLLLVASGATVMAQSNSALVTASTIPDYVAITGTGRVRWVVSSTLGPSSLIVGAFTAGRATQSNSPPEYGTHWDGFGKRYGLRLSGKAASTLMEAGIGSLWGEDPRYFRTSGQPVKTRLNHVLRMTFLSRNRAGNEMPAYARYIAIPGSTFITNTWRPDSQTPLRNAMGRISFSLVSRVLGNLFSEFRPRR